LGSFSEAFDGLGRQSLGPGDLFEFHLFPVFEGPKTVSLDAAEVDENVRSLRV
jgi:hypothetical protein